MAPTSMRVVTSTQIAELDRRASEEFGIATAVLMENAGRRVAQVVGDLLRDRGGRRVVLLTGKGNNGGDGLVASRHLRAEGFDVTALLVSPQTEFAGEPARVLRAAEEAGVLFRPAASMAEDQLGTLLASADVIVDGLFGTGFRGPARGVAATLIEQANASGKPIVAVDIPSGLHSDTGRWEGPVVHAAATVTMGLPKIGLLIFPGAEPAGQIYVADIGYPPQLVNDSTLTTHVVTAGMVRAVLPPRRPDSHKGTYGHVLIIAGSIGFTGAAVLSALGALRTGAGLVTLGVPESIYPIVASKITEGMPHPLPDSDGALTAAAIERVRALATGADVIAAGPGLSRAPGVMPVVEELLRSDRPVVLDADALNLLAGRAAALAKARAPVVITPHPGELARLLDSSADRIQADRLAAAREAAARSECVVVLKGARTTVAAPDGEAFIVPTGNPGMATGGMGDVLTGAIASLIGQGHSPLEAGYAAAYLHGLAADVIAESRGRVGMLASEVADHLPVAIQRVQQGEVHEPIIELRD